MLSRRFLRARRRASWSSAVSGISTPAWRKSSISSLFRRAPYAGRYERSGPDAWVLEGICRLLERRRRAIRPAGGAGGDTVRGCRPDRLVPPCGRLAPAPAAHHTEQRRRRFGEVDV